METRVICVVFWYITMLQHKDDAVENALDMSGFVLYQNLCKQKLVWKLRLLCHHFSTQYTCHYYVAH